MKLRITENIASDPANAFVKDYNLAFAESNIDYCREPRKYMCR